MLKVGLLRDLNVDVDESSLLLESNTESGLLLLELIARLDFFGEVIFPLESCFTSDLLLDPLGESGLVLDLFLEFFIPTCSSSDLFLGSLDKSRFASDLSFLTFGDFLTEPIGDPRFVRPVLPVLERSGFEVVFFLSFLSIAFFGDSLDLLGVSFLLALSLPFESLPPSIFGSLLFANEENLS